MLYAPPGSRLANFVASTFDYFKARKSPREAFKQIMGNG